MYNRNWTFNDFRSSLTYNKSYACLQNAFLEKAPCQTVFNGFYKFQQ